MMALNKAFETLALPWQDQNYNLLPNDQDKESRRTSSDDSTDTIVDPNPTTYRTRSRKRFWTVLSVSILLALIVVFSTTYVAFKLTVPQPAHKPAVTQCGSTPSEAWDRGCIFETTLSLWVPPDCYDFELETVYLQQPDLKFYRDVNLTEEVPLREVKTGKSPGWFVPWDHHVRHCSFAWRKFHRAAAFGKKVDGYVLQYAHTEHCIKMMTEPEKWRTDMTQFDMAMYPNCGKEGGFNVNAQHRGEWT